MELQKHTIKNWMILKYLSVNESFNFCNFYILSPLNKIKSLNLSNHKFSPERTVFLETVKTECYSSRSNSRKVEGVSNMVQLRWNWNNDKNCANFLKFQISLLIWFQSLVLILYHMYLLLDRSNWFRWKICDPKQQPIL